VLHLLHIDLLEQCADIDALNQLHDTLVQLLVVNLVLIVLLNHLGVLCSQHLLLARQPLLLWFELRKTQLLLDDIILVRILTAPHLFLILFRLVEFMLDINLQVKHLLALLFFDLKLLEDDLGLILLVSQTMLQFHRQLSLSFEMLGLLVSLSDTSSLNLVLKLKVLFVNTALLSQSLFDLDLTHLLLVLQVFNTRISNWDVNFDEISLLASLHGLSLCFFGQVAIVKLACLLVFSPAIRQDLVI